MRTAWTCFLFVALAAIALGSGPCSGQGDISVMFMRMLGATPTKHGVLKAKGPIAAKTVTAEVFADDTKAWNASGLGFGTLSGTGKKKTSRKYTTLVNDTQELLIAREEIKRFIEDAAGIAS